METSPFQNVIIGNSSYFPGFFLRRSYSKFLWQSNLLFNKRWLTSFSSVGPLSIVLQAAREEMQEKLGWEIERRKKV